MSGFLALIKKELLVLGRDRHGLAVLFVMPAVFILIMSLATRDSFNERKALSVDFLYVDLDGGAPADSLKSKFESLALFTLREDKSVGDVATTQAQVAAENYKFAVLLPEGFSERIAQLPDKDSSEQTLPALVQLYFSPSVLPQAKTLFEMSVRQMLQRVRAEWLIQEMGDDANAPDLKRLMDPQLLAVSQAFSYRSNADGPLPSAVQQNVPAWLVFAMFFVVIPLSTAFIVERQQGSLLRLRVMNISALTLISAKVFPYYLINMVQMIIMLAVGAWLVPWFGGDRLALGSSPLGLLLIGSATSFAAIGFALMIATLAKTSVQATTFGGVINLVFAALGGIMVPKMVMSSSMRELADYSPMSWGLEGFWDILLRQGVWTDVLAQAGLLMAFGGCALLCAAFLFTRQV